MTPRVVDLDELDATRVDLAGGKGAQLGELTRVDGVDVPAGFCVTTAAYRDVALPAVEDLLEELARLGPADTDAVTTLGARIRDVLDAVPLPADLVTEVGAALARLGAATPVAVRSSATAEDLPTASFAGQHDSYLDVVGLPAVLDHLRRCWASLFTERAVTYRRRHGFDDRAVRMAVVVQRMVAADAAGVLFTADPVSGDRTVATVEAVVGLGEALVSGRVNPDSYRVRGDVVTATTVAAAPVLTDAQVRRLVKLGRRIETHVGRPQDVEWCLTGDGFRIVQSRSITTLFPVPVTDDGENHVYVSVGHQQMMTDPLKPLGLSVWHLTTSAVMTEAGGRLFVDVTRRLASPASRAGMLGLARSDPLVGDALQSVVDRDGFLRPLPDAAAPPPLVGGASTPVETDPALVTALIARSETSLAALRRDIAPLSGEALFAFMLEAFEEDKRLLFDPQSLPVIMAGMESSWWLNDHLLEWLGERNAADTLTLSAPHNVTSEMGLALLDVGDVVRPHPKVVAFLERVEAERDDAFLPALAAIPGGAEAHAALEAYLDRYGMRCAGEIDITRPRWREQPATIVPAILTAVRNSAPGAAARRFEQGRERAEQKRQDVVTRVRALPDGEHRAVEVEQMIDRVRTFIGYREYPKYNRICRAFVYRQALRREAERWVRAGVLHAVDDIDFLRFEELQEVARTHVVDDALIARRRQEFRSFEALTPPRVLTSDGEAVHGAYRRDDLPPGALAGLGVSAGTVEGRARVVLDLAQADLEPGDILVTAFTDPSWTPLFLAVSGLVTEVGGLMTHGAVIAREYGLPAVVGVEGATRLIRDGRRIRLHGTAGYVELLD